MLWMSTKQILVPCRVFLVAGERRKVARFQRGLRYSIEKQMIPFKLTSYDEAVSIAQMLEQGENAMILDMKSSAIHTKSSIKTR